MDRLTVQYSWASLVNSNGKESACNAGDLGLIPGLGRSPGGGQPPPVLLPGESHGQRSLAGDSPRGPKRRTVLSD